MSDLSDYRKQEESVTYTAATTGELGLEQELMTVNMGPHHPPRTGCCACC